MEEVETFSWRIPSVTDKELPILCEGFMRPLSHSIIPKCITDLCIDYYTLNDEITLKDLISIKPYSQIIGPTFKLFDCEWRLIIFRNRAYINFRLQLLSLFGTMTNINADATFSYSNKSNNPNNSIITTETQLNWSWDKGSIQKWKNNINHQQFIRETHFELNLKLKLNKLGIDETSAKPENKCADYLMLKRVTNTITKNLTDIIMKRFDILENRLNYIEHRMLYNNDNNISIDNDADHDDVIEKTAKLMELRKWLDDNVGLGQYFHIFMEHGIEDLETVKLLTPEALKQMDIYKVGHQLKLINHIEKLR